MLKSTAACCVPCRHAKYVHPAIPSTNGGGAIFACNTGGLKYEAGDNIFSKMLVLKHLANEHKRNEIELTVILTLYIKLVYKVLVVYTGQRVSAQRVREHDLKGVLSTGP